MDVGQFLAGLLLGLFSAAPWWRLWCFIRSDELLSGYFAGDWVRDGHGHPARDAASILHDAESVIS
jgi:hypothetical protein